MKKLKIIIAGIILCCVVIFFFLGAYNFVRVTVNGASMEKTLNDGDKILVYKGEKEYGFGDIVVAHNPFEYSKYIVKRVIGVPGDCVEIIDGKLYINGILKNETYIEEPWTAYNNCSFNVPENCYVVLGDNRNESIDSRNWEEYYFSDPNMIPDNSYEYEYLEENLIIGKALFRYKPDFMILN